MFKFFASLFDENKKSLDSYQKIVNQINDLEPKIQKLSDTKLASQTKKFKKIISKVRAEVVPGDSEAMAKAEERILDEILPEAFATVREVANRVLGMRHYDVQLLAGIALHKKNVTEQKTGEGKTLTVTAPLYLNALLEKGAHLVTVNDYLAEIGVGWMGPVYNFLGLKTSVIVHDHSRLFDPSVDSEDRGDERLEHFVEISRKEAYLTDITYGTNNEFGFDYLRDNMAQDLSSMTQRQDNAHHFTIVDEADSILIDEARTPLIISAPDSEPTKKYYDAAHMVKSLTRDQDYSIDEKSRSVTLTDLGVKRIEQKLGVKNLYEESFDTIHHVESALKAMTLYHRDKEYIVRDKEVVIVDDHTGRLMYGRRYSDGLHQSIEAKENVTIQQESRTLASISIQNYFRLYHKLSGMTGTASTEAEEFNTIYNVNVLIIPTHRPVVREDSNDVVYKTVAAKYSAIVREAEALHKEGRPVLVGTRSIENNQIIAQFLQRKKVPHQVLNAKNNEKEAFIISDAGKKGAITVATNIAGRGVDIVLGGASPELKEFRKKTQTKKKTALPEKYKDLRLPTNINPGNYKLKEYAAAIKAWQEAHDEVVELGGLHIIGTERHESRRIDNQLRGRAGRQGDPGSSQFFVSLDDEVMRIFGGEQIAKVMDFLKIEENQPIEHGMIGKSIESAQVKVEGFFFDQRKRLVEFDDVMNMHRDILYSRRRKLLENSAQEGESLLREQIIEYLENEVESIVMTRTAEGFTDEMYDLVIKDFVKLIPFDQTSQNRLRKDIANLENEQEIIEKYQEIIRKTYDSRIKVLGKEQFKSLEKVVVLSTIDEKWMDHLDEIDSLREGIWLRGDKKTVLSEYKKEAFIMFEKLVQSIESTIANRIFRIHPVQRPLQPVVPKNIELKKENIHESLAKEVSDATPPSAAAPRKTKGSLGDLAQALGTAKAGAAPQPGSKKIKIKRNDPCPCGSGRKYKKCGLIDAPEHKG
ncbi:MAG: preprotein translocase subunit SecA [Candidatus Pacebacteria bacterium]|jgi:preprotein translocase subunit SecA|nr:preprotein translocase subunit SecA [Candidatus Paceibacterota bacterium]MBT4651874.1 preprotein translocase subunit SecA [Candidatus Paceibacterota bacterium]MBT6755694.1 preprotein translocase subunit SecA [Candidatus Paceibacterota bacterium]MBT6921200.1 preprotein translocase subunit SecA [Candidatus Paceibacterota bacterium]